jgi:hypothetical protein
LTTLTGAPFSLSLGDAVNVKLLATNEKGDSGYSTVGSGAIIITAPDKPMSLSEDNSLRDPISLGLTWSEGASNGQAAVTEYRVNIA